MASLWALGWELEAPAPPGPPGVNQGRRRGVTKSPKPPRRKR